MYFFSPILFFLSACSAFKMFKFLNPFHISGEFFIEQNLHVHYKNELAYSIINLTRKTRSYNTDMYDEDSPDYDKNMEDYIQRNLKPYTEPIVIYSDSAFLKTLYIEKYKNVVQGKLNRDRKKWVDVDRILKVEDRYLKK